MSELTSSLAEEMYRARQSPAILRLTDRFPDLAIDDAYRIQLALVDQHCAEGGQRIVGKKIGVTSQPVMDLFSVREPKDRGVGPTPSSRKVL